VEKTTPDRPFWRQGDIFFVRLDEELKLDGATVLKSGVIARGETTGHAHRVSKASLAAGAALYILGRSLFLRSPEAETTIVHEEHGPLRLPAGNYAVVNQQEFDGLAWRRVLD
jgi:hypothetical protein